MVPVQFMSDLSEELKTTLEHLCFPSPEGEKSINIFEYGLPVLETDDEEEPFPYLIIRPIEGTINDSTSPQDIQVGMLIGIYNQNLKERGERYVLNVINDICERFMKNPVLKGSYYADEKIEWVMQADDTYPYFFGGIEMIFHIPAFRREDKYA